MKIAKSCAIFHLPTCFIYTDCTVSIIVHISNSDISDTSRDTVQRYSSECGMKYWTDSKSCTPQEVGGTLIGEDGIMVMAGAE